MEDVVAAVAEAREQPVPDPGRAGRGTAGRLGGSGEGKQEQHDQQSTDSHAANPTAGAGIRAGRVGSEPRQVTIDTPRLDEMRLHFSAKLVEPPTAMFIPRMNTLVPSPL